MTEYILEDLDEVKDIMVDNVQKISINMVNLDELDAKVNEMKDQSETFKKKTIFFKDKEWWKKNKLYFEVTGIVFLVIIMILVFILLSNMTSQKI
jgi:hypothetical protein